MNFYKKKNLKINFSFKTYKKKGNFFLKNKFETVNLKNIVYLLPFIVSLVEIISCKYQKNHFFFDKNFAIRNKVEEKILWQTFDFFKKKEFVFQNIKEYNVYNECFLIEVNKKNLFVSSGLIKKKIYN